MIDNTGTAQVEQSPKRTHIYAHSCIALKLTISIQIEYPLFGESDLNGMLDLLTAFGETVLQSGSESRLLDPSG